MSAHALCFRCHKTFKVTVVRPVVVKSRLVVRDFQMQWKVPSSVLAEECAICSHYFVIISNIFKKWRCLSAVHSYFVGEDKEYSSDLIKIGDNRRWNCSARMLFSRVYKQIRGERKSKDQHDCSPTEREERERHSTVNFRSLQPTG